MRKEQKILRTQFLKTITRALIYNSISQQELQKITPEHQKNEKEDDSHQKTNPLKKIRNFILDPGIQTIECPGPLKQIITNQNGITQPSNIRLTSEEINRIMSEFSKKTRIPLAPGIFKAALGHIIVTAVISDYLGTKFIIQKR